MVESLDIIIYAKNMLLVALLQHANETGYNNNETVLNTISGTIKIDISIF